MCDTVARVYVSHDVVKVERVCCRSATLRVRLCLCVSNRCAASILPDAALGVPPVVCMLVHVHGYVDMWECGHVCPDGRAGWVTAEC